MRNVSAPLPVCPNQTGFLMVNGATSPRCSMEPVDSRRKGKPFNFYQSASCGF